ncbi:MAG: hypothetical protein LBT46_01260 [Planctomycetaceae bacterium]|jgi:uncharacterized membrane protein|nr:hypothetical protein [Planctomycetaceae bacterium]
MFRIACYPIFGSYFLVILLIIVLVFVIRQSRITGGQLPPYGSRILIILRLLALLVLIFGFLRPAIIYTKAERLAAAVNILLDQSESMSRPDEIGGKTRFQVAKEALANAAGQIAALQKQVEVKAFAFDADVKPLEIKNGLVQNLPEVSAGLETALGYSLDNIRNISAGKRVLGTILISDGAQRCRQVRDILPQNTAQKLRDEAMPLYTVPLGQAGLADSVRDIAVDSIQGNNSVFVKNNFIVSGSIRINGFINQQIPVQLLFEKLSKNVKGETKSEMTVVKMMNVTATENGQIVPYRLTFAPQDVGTFKYTIRAVPQDKELVETNNEQSGFVRVIEGGLRVVCLLGNRNFEQGPLRQSLSASEDINVKYVRLTGAGKNKLETILKSEPANVFILGDVDSTFFTRSELQLLTDTVKNGAGLIMLGGLYSFGAGGYADTPLADVCPVELHKADRQQPDAPIRADIHWSAETPIPMLPTAEGLRHFVLRLGTDPQKTEERWKQLPGLLGANRFDRLKAGATVLAEGAEGERLLVTQMFGLGRVLAFAGDSTYRWQRAGFTEEHKLFWRQIIFWLAKMESGVNGDCWITLESDRLMLGDTANFRVFLKTPEGGDVKDFKANVTVLKPDNNKETVPLSSEDGTLAGAFRNTNFSGDYLIQAEVVLPKQANTPENTPPGDTPVKETKQTKQAAARFLVYNRNLELDNPVAYPSLLSSMAAVTGGKSIPPEQLGNLIDELIKESNDLVEKRETKQTLFDSWFVLLAFVLLITAEWFLRKHWGLA